MTNSNKKRNLLIFIYFLFIVTGIAAGHFINGEKIFDCRYFAPYSPNAAALITDNVKQLCQGQMLQFVILFVAAFSIFLRPISCFVLLYRGMCLGLCASAVSKASENTEHALCYIISYALITLVMLIFAVCLEKATERTSKDKAFKNAMLCGCKCTVLFLMTSGASLLIRLLPLMIFR